MPYQGEEAVFSYKIKHMGRNIPIPIKFPSTTMPPRSTHTSLYKLVEEPCSSTDRTDHPKHMDAPGYALHTGSIFSCFPFVFSFFLT